MIISVKANKAVAQNIFLIFYSSLFINYTREHYSDRSSVSVSCIAKGNIIVKKGVTLTIEPGVTVQFGQGFKLTIKGGLIAKGTDKQGIKFTPKEEKNPGAWGGILFEDSSIDAKFDDAGNYVMGSILQYCTVEYAETGVKAKSASPFIDHCMIREGR